MAIGATLLPGASAVDDTDASSYTTASVSPAAGSLLLVFVFTSAATDAATPTVSGLSLTWTQQAAVAFSVTARRVLAFTAPAGGSPGSGAITITAASSNACGWAVIEVTGADNSAPVVQSPTATDAGGTVLSVTLAAAGHADNRAFAAFLHRAATATTPRASWSELSDHTGAAPVHGWETQWRSDAFETTASASWTTSSACGVVALEIKAASDSTLAAVARAASRAAGVAVATWPLAGAARASSRAAASLQFLVALAGTARASSPTPAAQLLDEDSEPLLDEDGEPLYDQGTVTPLAVARSLAGVAAGAARATGNASFAQSLAVTPSAAARATAVLSAGKVLAGAPSASAAARGGLTVVTPLAVVAASSSGATAAAVTVRRLAAVSSAAGAVRGGLPVQKSFAAVASAAADVVVSLAGAVALDIVPAAASGVTGDLVVESHTEFSGTVPAAARARAELDVAAALTGKAAAAGASTGRLTLNRALAVTVSAASAASATHSNVHVLAVAPSAAAAVTVSLQGADLLAGATRAASGVTATLRLAQQTVLFERVRHRRPSPVLVAQRRSSP